ncbi:SWPV2-ORF144 [Shearwaterpox virus]|uniref:Arrestin domain-containing protein 3 n=1 Tax=Shearwaterpox virus TaxID=1974596 RepID=A0A1V0QGA3_CNPV|nr:SWPV2-ORF144 [Shearwaterpox virus]QRI42867.1 putative thioredoxin binding protein [Cheloniid poxvirus 1]QRM15427.1 putative thioredoxin binding protein [Mudlarkpox virus]QRM15782.1 putative thioredoxin binding protein [Penguinpox virus 2]QRM16114.1 putative thioredoxin binding protein [Albatrosspox virus]
MTSSKIKNIDIVFDYLNDSNTYFVGDTVSGRLILEVCSDVRIKFIQIIVKGYAKVHWSEKKKIGPIPITTTAHDYYKKIEYLNRKYILVKDTNSRVIHSGRHEYAFSFELPQSLPTSSFESKYGSIRYCLKAELHRDCSLPMKLKKELTVFEHVDINTPLLTTYQSGSKERTLLFCRSEVISLLAKIEKKGYVPGEYVRIVAEIENNSSRAVMPNVCIYQIQTFYTDRNIKKVRNLITSSRGKQLLPGNIEIWNNKQLKVPQVSHSILNCSIIRLEYLLVIYVEIPETKNISLEFPIVIGNSNLLV